MFTGIVEEIGTVRSLQSRGGGAELAVACRAVLAGTTVGDSINVDGVCLTVTRLSDWGFVAGLQPVTLRLSTLGRLRPGDPVNLERSVPADGRFGGHYVQGHVDGVGQVVALRGEGEALVVRIAAPREVLRYVVERGFIAVDGASLTVAELHDDGFSVSLVAYTQQHIALPRKGVGALVNLEVDVVAKYVERLIGQAPRSGLTLERLRRAGYA
jgi:riboflavin synthase